VGGAWAEGTGMVMSGFNDGVDGLAIFWSLNFGSDMYELFLDGFLL
jgi:hypothetical protein